MSFSHTTKLFNSRIVSPWYSQSVHDSLFVFLLHTLFQVRSILPLEIIYKRRWSTRHENEHILSECLWGSYKGHAMNECNILFRLKLKKWALFYFFFNKCHWFLKFLYLGNQAWPVSYFLMLRWNKMSPSVCCMWGITKYNPVSVVWKGNVIIYEHWTCVDKIMCTGP